MVISSGSGPVALQATYKSPLLHRILGCQNRIEFSHLMRGTVNADLPFFHNFEQGCLRLGGSAVYLVHQHEVGKHRSLMKVKVIGFMLKTVVPNTSLGINPE